MRQQVIDFVPHSDYNEKYIGKIVYNIKSNTKAIVKIAKAFVKTFYKWNVGCLIKEIMMNGYMTIKEASEKWNIGVRRINTLCLQGRIEGASKFGKSWAIPTSTEKPKDERVKSGKYIKLQR